MRYATVVADPPWQYSDRGGPSSSKEHRPNSSGTLGGTCSSHNRYGSMSMRELEQIPVPEWADQNSHLYLWTTNAFISEAHSLAKAWDFEPKTVLTWGKVKPDGSASMKMGHYYRGATEHVIFCVRGRLKLIGDATRPTLFLSPRLGHSVKPDWFYSLVEEQSPGPRLEMFARRSREGWDGWGDQYSQSSGAEKP